MGKLPFILKQIRKGAGYLLPLFSVVSIIVLIYDIGFQHSKEAKNLLETYYYWFVFIAFVLLLLRVDYIGVIKRKVKYTTIELILFFSFAGIWILQYFLRSFLIDDHPLRYLLDLYIIDILMIVLLFVVEISIGSLNLGKFSQNPAIVFLISFVLLIVIGTLLLLLPNSTNIELSVIDALFTSTSAVCVTGLIVVDTATAFTPMGQTIILVLIQAGGIGILTFTSFFGMYLRTSSSFQSQLMLGDMLNEDRMSDIFKNLVRVIVFTISIELIFAGFLYVTLDPLEFSSDADMIRFSIFHSISAFCNAGFSTMSDGLYDSTLRYNYSFLLLIATLVVIGGLGFNIIFNFFRYMKYKMRMLFHAIVSHKPLAYRPRIINVHSKIVTLTTVFLLVFGTIMYLLLEKHHTLADHGPFGKVVTAFFGAVTPRTAGFNTVDMTLLAPATIIIYFLLMLIGGSPGSTAGGIKTTTFAVTVMNVYSLARGKNRIEIFRRELSIGSIRRAFAVISISLLIIGLSVFMLHVLQPELDSTKVLFECISAFCTVGLTLGITPELHAASKVVIIFTMLLGRIGTLTILLALFRKVSTLSYRYPTESILIS
mgnify:FL=1